MGWRVISITAPIVIIESGAPNTGLFVYNGTPALGNPPVAYATAPGITHDPFGNLLPATGGGFTTVSGIQFANLLGFTLNFGGTGLTSTASVGISASGGSISIASATTAAAPGQGTLSISPSAGLADPLALLNALLRLTSGLAGNELLGLRVTGDTVDRLAINSNGQLSWGTGALAADTTFARTAAGQLTISNALVVATILTNKLELATGAVPAAVSGAAVQAADASGFPVARPDSASADTTIYNLGHFSSFNTSDQLINSLTFTTICGGGATVGTGKYLVHAELTCVQGSNIVPNDYRLGFTGTINQVRMKAVFQQDNTSSFVATTTSNNGLLASHAYGAATTYVVTLHGIIVTTSSGTLSIQAAMDAATDTFTVLALSDFHLEPLS